MGCSTSQAATVATKENGINEKAEADRKYPPAEAFEVPLDEDTADSIIKKHPPKRLQRLVDAPTTQTTIEELEEKLANAEIRRNQFLMERANTLKSKDDEENDIETSNEQRNDETNTEPPIADRDSSLDEPTTDNKLSDIETQENH